MDERPVTVVALALLVLGAPSAAQTPTAHPGLPTVEPEAVGMSAERLARIGPVMQGYIDEQLAAGTVTLIARRGKVVHFEARGFMDAESGTPMRPDAISASLRWRNPSPP